MHGVSNNGFAHTELRSRLTGRGFADVTSQWIAPNSPGMAQLNPGIDAWRSVAWTSAAPSKSWKVNESAKPVDAC
jgi:hypothetical protein